MTLELRPLALDDEQQHKRLMHDSFARGDLSELFVETALMSPTPFRIGIFDGDRLVAATTIHKIPISWKNQNLIMGGVAGVACVPDQRGNGHVAWILKESLIWMHSQGMFLSGLYPFSYGFYRKHGWEWVGRKNIYRLQLSLIPSFAEGKHVRLYPADNALPMVKRIYKHYIYRYPGMSTRELETPNFWNVIEDKNKRATYLYIYENPSTGEPEGYLTFRFRDYSDTGDIGDFFANTAEAYKGLISILHYYGTQIKYAEWSAPEDDFLPFYVMEHGLDIKTAPLFMGRIVDVIQALNNINYVIPYDDHLNIEIVDHTCEWNNGVFEIDITPSGIKTQRTHEKAGMKLDIQTLSQAYWGSPSLTTLRRAGRITVYDERQFEYLTRLLPATTCYLQDFF